MKKVRGYVAAAAILLVIAAVFRFVMVGYKFLDLCFAGLAVLILMYMGLKLLAEKHPKGAGRVRNALTACVVLGLAAVIATEGYIVSQVLTAKKGETREDYAVVLGAGVNGTVPSRALWARLRAAEKFAAERPQAILILSGGQGPGEDISEAQCMANWLTQHGVAPERLVLEDRSTSTAENLTFSLEKLRELGAGEENVCIITGGYHIARAKLMALDLGYASVTARPASTGYPVLEFNYYLRECAGIWWYLITS